MSEKENRCRQALWKDTVLTSTSCADSAPPPRSHAEPTGPSPAGREQGAAETLPPACGIRGGGLWLACSYSELWNCAVCKELPLETRL